MTVHAVVLSEKIASKRTKCTVDAAKMIHSYPQTPDEVSKTDALNGMWKTFVSYATERLPCYAVDLEKLIP